MRGQIYQHNTVLGIIGPWKLPLSLSQYLLITPARANSREETPSYLMQIIDCLVLNSTLLFSGDVPGHEEGDSPAVQAEGQVLPRGRGRGADPGRHPEAFLPAGEGGHSDRGDLLPSRVCRPAGLLRRPGQVRRVQTDGERGGLPVLRAPAAQEVRSRS